MSRIRMMAMIGGTVASALGIGYVMQYGQAVPRPVATLKPAAIQQMELDPQAPPISVPESQALPETPSPDTEAVLDAPLRLRNITLTAALPPVNVPRALPPLRHDVAFSRESPTARDIPMAPADPATPHLGCAVVATANVIPLARVRLSVAAPCYGNERLTVHHNGMMFTAVTDDAGNLVVDVPVLAEKATLVMVFANGKGAVAQAHVPALAGFDRVALQWSGREGFQIHAREFGASYSDAGHIWSGSAGTTGTQVHGFVTRLGDVGTLAPKIVEIYSFPSKTSDRSGTVAMTVEAEVTAANCGRDVSAQTLELSAGRHLRTRDLVLSVPDCTAVGDFLVLNNLVKDLKIAGN